MNYVTSTPVTYEQHMEACETHMKGIWKQMKSDPKGMALYATIGLLVGSTSPFNLLVTGAASVVGMKILQGAYEAKLINEYRVYSPVRSLTLSHIINSRTIVMLAGIALGAGIKTILKNSILESDSILKI